MPDIGFFDFRRIFIPRLLTQPDKYTGSSAIGIRFFQHVQQPAADHRPGIGDELRAFYGIVLLRRLPKSDRRDLIHILIFQRQIHIGKRDPTPRPRGLLSQKPFIPFQQELKGIRISLGGQRAEFLIRPLSHPGLRSPRRPAAALFEAYLCLPLQCPNHPVGRRSNL